MHEYLNCYTIRHRSSLDHLLKLASEIPPPYRLVIGFYPESKDFKLLQKLANFGLLDTETIGNHTAYFWITAKGLAFLAGGGFTERAYWYLGVQILLPSLGIILSLLAFVKCS